MREDHRFWMICRRPLHARSKTEPRARFTTEAKARAEAQRLADETDADFVVLTATDVIRPRRAIPDLF